MAAASDLTEILTLLAQEAGQRWLSEQTQPKKSDCIIWVNDSNIFIASYLAPQRIDVGKWTPGRVDRLQKQQATATANDGLDPEGVIALPTSPKPFCYFGEIRVQGYRATEVSLRELFDRGSTGAIFAATTAAPIYAWGSGFLLYRPIAANATVIFNFLTLPALMVLSSQEVYPLSKDLIPITLDYGRMMINLQGAKDPARADMFLEKVLGALDSEVKANQQLIEPAKI